MMVLDFIWSRYYQYSNETELKPPLYFILLVGKKHLNLYTSFLFSKEIQLVLLWITAICRTRVSNTYMGPFYVYIYIETHVFMDLLSL